MTPFEVENEPEVDEWFFALPHPLAVRVAFYIDMLAENGALLGEPHSRQLDGKLRELRISLPDGDWRVSYFLTTGRRAILLTVFKKRRQRETAEIARARRAMERCVAEGHTAEETI